MMSKNRQTDSQSRIHPRRLKQKALESDTVARELVESDVDATRNTRLPVPSTNPATNLVIADVVLRGISLLLRKNIEKKVAKASYGDESRAHDLVKGRTIGTSLALYGASRLATRSPLGLGVVTGALIAKTLYDRGKTRQRQRRNAGTDIE